MPERRRAGHRVAGILVVAVLVTATVMAIRFAVWGAGRSGGERSVPLAVNENSPLADLNKALADRRSPGACHHRAARHAQTRRAANSLYRSGSRRVDRNADALRASYRKMDAPARVSCGDGRLPDLRSVCRRTGTARWVEALKPLHDLLSASLGDAEPRPRYAALQEISRFWVWIPGRSLTPAEEQMLAEWKGGLYLPVVPLPRQPRCPDPGCHRHLPGDAADRQRGRSRGRRVCRRPRRRRPTADHQLIRAPQPASHRRHAAQASCTTKTPSFATWPTWS